MRRALLLCVSRMVFFNCFSVCLKGMKEEKGKKKKRKEYCLYTVGPNLTSVSVCGGVWFDFIVFWFAHKELRIQKNLSTEIGSTPSRSSLLYCPNLSSLVVCGGCFFFIVFRFARREFVSTPSCSSLLYPNLSSLWLCGRVWFFFIVFWFVQKELRRQKNLSRMCVLRAVRVSTPDCKSVLCTLLCGNAAALSC